MSTLFCRFVISCYPVLPPRKARCSTLHGIRLKSDTVHRYLWARGFLLPVSNRQTLNRGGPSGVPI
ncbi:hypothetical protein BVM85_22650 [Salmonella enterica]|nr:hypothetical protein [Salmonella enterica]